MTPEKLQALDAMTPDDFAFQVTNDPKLYEHHLVCSRKTMKELCDRLVILEYLMFRKIDDVDLSDVYVERIIVLKEIAKRGGDAR